MVLMKLAFLTRGEKFKILFKIEEMIETDQEVLEMIRNEQSLNEDNQDDKPTFLQGFSLLKSLHIRRIRAGCWAFRK